jgi:serine/threonine protein kinase
MPSPVPETPQSFGRYKDPVMLGSGGMGSVYRAIDPSLDRYVAIKVLTHREPKYIERFRREAQVLAKIMHPSIIQIYEIVGTDEDAHDPYIVMEYFDGKPLDSALKMGPLKAAPVVNILRQTAEGLKKAHGSHVIHRDIKPANIMVSADGEVKILDFGIAKLRDAKKDLTGQTVLGTPYYMSPEQAMGQPIDARTDIYSLGITAFQLLTGKRPFEAKNKVDVMVQQVKQPLPDMRQLVALDERVVKIVERMCDKQPSKRFADCQALIEALDDLPRQLGGKQADVSATIPEVSSPSRKRAAPQPQPTPARAPTPEAPRVQRQPARPAPEQRPKSRSDVRKTAPKPTSRMWIGVVVGAGAGFVVLALAAALLLRGPPTGPWRVPAQGWKEAGGLKLVHQNRYGNCVFSTREVERGKENREAVRHTFEAGEPIHARCYFARSLGPNNPEELWHEVFIDGDKRAQIIYPSSFPPEEDQFVPDLSKLPSRLADLSSGKHIVDIWIYRQPEGTRNPEPLAAGELLVRK